jgi:hypothetical protein
MPNDADEARALPEWDWLEMSVRRLLEEHEAWQRRAEAAERRLRQVEATMHQVSSGQMDPVSLERRCRELEEINRKLEQRLATARETVTRIMARLKFAEEET